MDKAEAREAIEEFLNPEGSHYTPRKAKRPQHPTGFEPGIHYTGKEAQVTTYTDSAVLPDWEEVFKSNGFTAEEFDIVDDTIEVRTWDANMGDGNVVRFWYYKAKFIKKRGDIPNTDDVWKAIRKAKVKENRPKGDDTFVIFASDWQVGKKDGDGIVGFAQRVEEKWDLVEARIKELRKQGVEMGTGVLVGMGDLVEGCTGHYDMQTFTVELDRRQQKNFARRALAEGIKRFAPMFDQFIVVGVGGNHGENRLRGKAYTSFGDNDDVALLDELYDAFKDREAFSHVKFIVPENDLAVSLNFSGQNVSFIHGHQAKNAGKPIQKLWGWWQNQALGDREVGMSRILVAGHFHQFAAHTQGNRSVIICPTLDGGSDWYAETQGQESLPSLLTLTFSDDSPYGWDHLKVL